MNQSEQVTIIYAHPWDGSFNQAELTTVKKRLDERKQPYTVIDLNAVSVMVGRNAGHFEGLF